ncbi:hypothetical protein KC318_g19160, partial [Hortaea werneckii]
MAAVAKRAYQVPAHEEEAIRHHESDDDTESMDESMGPLEESGATVSEDEEVDDAVADDIERF